MKNAIRAYKQLTGSEPKNLAMLGYDTSKKLAEQFSALAEGLGYDPNPREMEFLKAKRTKDGYFIRLVDVHRKENGQYSGVTLDVDHALIEELGPAIASLNVGESVVFPIQGKDNSEIIRKRSSYLHGREQTSAQPQVDRVLSQQHLTETQLIRDHAFEIRGNDRTGYVADVVVRNQRGIHARPAALITRAAGKYDCSVFLTKCGTTKTVSAKSVMGLLTVEASRGTNLILQAKGSDAKACLEEIVGFFSNDFGEKN